MTATDRPAAPPGQPAAAGPGHDHPRPPTAPAAAPPADEPDPGDAELAAALDVLAGPMLLADPDDGRWTVRWANAAATRAGLGPGASLASRYAAGYLADLMARALAVGPGVPATRDVEVGVEADGVAAWVELRLVAVGGRALVAWRDVTEARAARARHHEAEERLRHEVHEAAEQHEAELLERERIYRDLIEGADVVFYSVGPDPLGGNEYISPRVADILGHPPERWYEPGFWMTTVHPDDLPGVLDRMTREDMGEYEYRGIAADGRPVWFLERVRTIRDDEGRVTRRVGVTFDQSSRKAAEEELRASEDRFRTVVDELDAVVFAVENDGRVWVSPQVEPILGYTPAELATSADWRRIVFPDDRDRVMVAWDNRSGERHELEYRVRRGDGELIWVSEHLRAVRGPTGEPVRWYGLIVDITERRLLRERLLRQARLEDAGRLAAAVAHDFDNVLFGIRVHAHVLAEHEDDPGRAADLERILEAAERGNALVRQLLSVGRSSDTPHVPVDLAAIVARIEPLLARLGGPGIRLRTLAPDSEVSAVIDPGTLEQILCNLVLNARDAMPDGGLLTIEVAAEVHEPDAAVDAAPAVDALLDADADDRPEPAPSRGIARLAVHDTGSGMEPKVAAHAFEPFFTTKHEGEGSGLGLASVRHLVRAAGGEVRLYTAPGAGTTVELRLPLVR